MTNAKYRTFAILDVYLEQENNGVKQKISMCVEADEKTTFIGQHTKAIEHSALTDLQAEIAELKASSDHLVISTRFVLMSKEIAELKKQNEIYRKALEAAQVIDSVQWQEEHKEHMQLALHGIANSIQQALAEAKKVK